ncbi:winged helix-turn-helix transcriptional regulator [Albimonas pacifica]|uniref:Transcriptional regulator, HxlR family n=1 Tax=Albimonas pacifica TaxID=1114924 RepID=A0A1I3MC11_9RHOB|nr:helix-turn-helix domain-containing protein [Albimonas pacifica]SFI94462.1 transcriptional regulator, HxlR family [Albimonas pacifica]
MKRADLSSRHCPIARASAELADGWTFVILREILFRNTRFNGLLRRTGMAPRLLSARLKDMVANGILDRRPDPADARSAEYRLTRKGEALWPLLMHLKQWGDDWCGPWDEADPPVRNLHRGHDHPLRVVAVCETCGEPVAAGAATSVFSDLYRRERTGEP